MSTLLQKRQATALKNLKDRKAKAEAYIELHASKLAEKIAPYQQEVEIVAKMIDEHIAANPDLLDNDLSDEGKSGMAINA